MLELRSVRLAVDIRQLVRLEGKIKHVSQQENVMSSQLNANNKIAICVFIVAIDS
jgi:hypothetical protein